METCRPTSQTVGKYLWRLALLPFCKASFSTFKAVQLLQSIFPSWEPLNGDTETCAICDAEVHMSKEDKKEVRRRIEEEKVSPLDVTDIFLLIGHLRPAWNLFMNLPWTYGRATPRWFLMQSSHPDSSKIGRGGWAIPLRIQDRTQWIIAFFYVNTISCVSTPPVQVMWIPAWQSFNLISGRGCRLCECLTRRFPTLLKVLQLRQRPLYRFNKATERWRRWIWLWHLGLLRLSYEEVRHSMLSYEHIITHSNHKGKVNGRRQISSSTYAVLRAKRPLSRKHPQPTVAPVAPVNPNAYVKSKTTAKSERLLSQSPPLWRISRSW